MQGQGGGAAGGGRQQVGDHDTCAGGKEAFRDGLADVAAAAGDEDSSVGDALHGKSKGECRVEVVRALRARMRRAERAAHL